MGSRRGHLALAAVVLAAAVCASAAAGASLRVLVTHSPNKTDSNRTSKTISGIVIHDTEGRFVGSVRFLQKSRARGSAHFVVSRTGQIVQLVPVTDVAWHAGNSYWNLHSIGIEHEGWADHGRYTVAEYRASAQLTAYLAKRWGIPLDREHIIGHDEVPNPYHPGRYGGVSGHYDPGKWWNWTSYMWLVRYYASHPVLPKFVKSMTLHDSLPPGGLARRAVRDRLAAAAATARTLSTPAPVVKAKPKPVVKAKPKPVVQAKPKPVVRAKPRVVARVAHRAPAVVDKGATLKGTALWWSGVDATRRWRKHIYKVDFIVDGKTMYTDNTWPYSFHRHEGWNTRSVANGRHMLAVLAYGTHHYRARKRIPVRVSNDPLSVKVIGAVSGGAVKGELTLGVRVSESVERIALYVDGKPVSRDGSGPYSLRWDTTAAAEGAHTLLVYARGKNGRRAALELPVVVANAETFPDALARNWVTHEITSEL